MYFFEQKAILPITDDILRQTGGIKGLRERVRSVDGLYLSTDEDEIVVPLVYKRYYFYDSYEGKNKVHTTVDGESVLHKPDDVLHLIDKLEIKYNIKELRLIKEIK